MINTDLFKVRVATLKGRRSNETYGKAVGCDAKTVSTAINHGKVPGIDILSRMAEDGGVPIGWILGEDGKNEGGMGDNFHNVDEKILQSTKTLKPVIKAELIGMISDILESETVYRTALASSVRALHHAVKGEAEMNDLRKTFDSWRTKSDKDMEELKNMIRNLSELKHPEKKQSISGA